MGDSSAINEAEKQSKLIADQHITDVFQFALSYANNFASFLVAGTVGYVLVVVTSLLWPRPWTPLLLTIFIMLYLALGTGFGYSLLRYFYYTRLLNQVIKEKGFRSSLDHFDAEVGTYGPSRVMLRYSREIAVLAGVMFTVVFVLVLIYGQTA